MANKKGAGSAQKRGRAAPRSQIDELAVSSEDELAAGAEHVALEPGAPGSESGSEAELGVYDLDDSDASSSDDDDDEGEDDDDVVEAALLAGGKAAQLAKQARYLEHKLKLQQGEDEDEDEPGEPARPSLRDKLWGGNKRAYYQDDDGQQASDEEALAAEEAEVRRLQAEQAAAAGDDDYGLPGPGGRPQQLGDAGADQLARPVEVEAVARDLQALTQEEQLAVVMADAPELLSLLDELRACLDEVRGKVAPLLREVSAGGLATAPGLSYLEAKHLLLLQYCMCIVAYLMLKAEGASVGDHPVIARLVQLRAYIERIRPIDKQLAYQIDKLLRATAVAQASAEGEAAAAAGGGSGEQRGAAAGEEDALRFRPRPQALIAKAPLLGDTSGLDAAPAGVYRPPKLNPVAMEEDRALSSKEQRRLREAQRKAKRSSVLRDLEAELLGAPEEVTAELPGMESAAAVAARHRLEARAAAEEELMLRVPLSKGEAQKLKAQRRAGLSGAGLTDFADEVADLVAVNSSAGALGQAYGKRQLGQQYGADLASQQAKALRSGDDDLRPRAPLHERRAAFDAVAARRAAAEPGDAATTGSGRKRAPANGEEDAFYAAAKASRDSAKAAKRAKHTVPTLAPPLAEPEATGARKISAEIQKNRGLTPHRRKDLKNPRKKHRIKFAQAVVRRKGQVQGVKQAPATPSGYGGEASGINRRTSKSTKLG